MEFAYHQVSEFIRPEDVDRVPPHQWFQLLGNQSQVTPWTFGFTDDFVSNGMDLRTLPEHVLYFVTDGAFEAVFPKETVTVTRGALIWIMAGATHETRPLAGPVPFRNYYFRIKIATPEGRLFRLKDDWVLKEQAWEALPYVKQLADEFQSQHVFHNVRVRAILELLTSWAFAPGDGKAPEQRSLTPQQRTRLLRHMETNGGNGVTPDSLANMLGFSPVYFARIFRSTFGVSPKVWIVQQRIRVAAMLLAGTQSSLKEIALRLGYSDFFMFSRQFKQVMGVSPRSYRDGIAK
jgi:AraC-like DNA-binding protein